MKVPALYYSHAKLFKRARWFWLYNTAKERYLDMFQAGGRYILGHRIDGLHFLLKSTLAKGLDFVSLSNYKRKITRHLIDLFPHHQVLLFFDYHTWMKWVNLYRKQNNIHWLGVRPLLDLSINKAYVSFLPLPYFLKTYLCLLPKENLNDKKRICIQVGDAFSLAAVKHIISAMYQFKKKYPSSFFSSWDTPLFRRKYLYLYPNYPSSFHSQVYHLFRANKIYISPMYQSPSCLPYHSSSYDHKLFHHVSQLLYTQLSH